MSAAASVVSSFLASAAVVAVPTAGMVVAESSSSMPEPTKAAVYLLSGLTLVIVFLGNLGKALPVMRTLLTTGEAKTIPRPDHPLPRDHAAMPVTHGELENHLRRIEAKIDGNSEASRDEIKDLTKTMEACFRDLTRQVSLLDVRTSSKPPR